MNNKTELLRLLRLAWVADYVSAADCKKIDAILAAPAEDVRAVVEEPVVIGTLHRDCDERIVFESAGEIHIKDGMELFSHPQRPVVLPERFDAPHRGEYESADHHAAAVHEANTWSACLDAVEELNK